MEADEPVAVAKFMTHGFLKGDGSDLRIIAKGKEIPSRVLTVGPGDEVTVAFQLVVGVETYVVCGKRDSGVICMNGAAARLIHRGDLVIVMGFELSDAPIKASIVLVDEKNCFVRYL